MLVYKDQIWCPFYDDCRHGKTCPRALTDSIISDANNADLLIDQYTYKPFCWERIKKHGGQR